MESKRQSAGSKSRPSNDSITVASSLIFPSPEIKDFRRVSGGSQEDLRNNLCGQYQESLPTPSCSSLEQGGDLRESSKALEKSLDELENIVKLFKSDMNKPLPFKISDYNFPSSLLNGSPEK